MSFLEHCCCTSPQLSQNRTWSRLGVVQRAKYDSEEHSRRLHSRSGGFFSSEFAASYARPGRGAGSGSGSGSSAREGRRRHWEGQWEDAGSYWEPNDLRQVSSLMFWAVLYCNAMHCSVQYCALRVWGSVQYCALRLIFLQSSVVQPHDSHDFG